MRHGLTGSTRSLGLLAGALGASLLAPAASAQFNNQWLTFVKDTTRIVNANGTVATHITTDTEEKDYAWGDLNKDGYADIVSVRKTPASFPGKRVNHLLMSELVGGVRKFVDRTTQYASATDLPGDNGFNTPTDDRDAEIVDINGDTWLDVLTAATDLANENGNAFKNLTHPRIYINLGNDGSGNWLGLRFENARIPKLTVTAGGANGTVRFCDMAPGDVDNDGDLDLYFNDYDVTENGFPEPAGSDLNDRLLLNDGNGFFTDTYGTRIQNSWLACQFGTACEIADYNGDGRKDITRITTLFGSPQAIQVFYNDIIAPSVPTTGFFDAFQSTAFSGQPYHTTSGDLNNDGRLDLVNSDDGIDGYKLNTGNDGTNQVVWSAKKNMVWLTGSGDPGFSGNNYISDFNLDGWNDIFIADFDVDLLGCTRRSQFFHNATTVPGTQSTTLREEKQQSGSGGWFSAVGLLQNDMTGGYDGAFPDIDKDGDQDFVFGECNGTTVWINQTNPVECADNLGFQGPGNLALSVCGQPLYAGNTATCSVTNGTPGGTAYFFASFSILSSPVNLLGGTLAAFPIAVTFALPIGAGGTVAFPIAGGIGEVEADLQVLGTDPSQTYGVEFSNAVRVQMH